MLDIAAADANWSGLVRIKAWHDAGLARDGRPWGNVVNGYGAGAPLSDRGMPRLSRFSGVALLDAWIEGRAVLAGMPVLGRIGQQSTTRGERSMTPGGLEALNPRDLPGLHRAAPIANEGIVPRPMLFGRIEPGAGRASGLALEAYYQSAFRPSALDACGTLWSMSDYLVEGCDRVMSGQPLVSDRARTALGVYQKRLPTLTPKAKEFGFGATWRPDEGLELGLYHARYHARTPLPGLRRTLRPGEPVLRPGDPDGRNMAYFTEYAEGLRITAATFSRKRAGTSINGEAVQPAWLRDAAGLRLPAAPGWAAATAGARAGGQRQPAVRARRQGLVRRPVAERGTQVRQPRAALRVPAALSGRAGLPALVGWGLQRGGGPGYRLVGARAALLGLQARRRCGSEGSRGGASLIGAAWSG